MVAASLDSFVPVRICRKTFVFTHERGYQDHATGKKVLKDIYLSSIMAPKSA